MLSRPDFSRMNKILTLEGGYVGHVPYAAGNIRQKNGEESSVVFHLLTL